MKTTEMTLGFSSYPLIIIVNWATHTVLYLKRKEWAVVHLLRSNDQFGWSSRSVWFHSKRLLGRWFPFRMVHWLDQGRSMNICHHHKMWLNCLFDFYILQFVIFLIHGFYQWCFVSILGVNQNLCINNNSGSQYKIMVSEIKSLVRWSIDRQDRTK